MTMRDSSLSVPVEFTDGTVEQINAIGTGDYVVGFPSGDAFQYVRFQTALSCASRVDRLERAGRPARAGVVCPPEDTRVPCDGWDWDADGYCTGCGGDRTEDAHRSEEDRACDMDSGGGI